MRIEAVIIGTPQAVARFKAAPEKARLAVFDAVKRQWFRLQAYVVQNKLSGQVLKRRTGTLASSINVGGAQTATEIEQTPKEIIAKVGTKVKYGRIHEEGGAFKVPAHERLITQAFGNPITPTVVHVGAYVAHYPQRSFLRSSVRDLSARIREDLSAEITRKMKAI